MRDLFDLKVEPPGKDEEEIAKLRSMPRDPDAVVRSVEELRELEWIPRAIDNKILGILIYEIDAYTFDLYKDLPQIGVVLAGPYDVCYVIYEPENTPNMIRADRELFIKYLELDE